MANLNRIRQLSKSKNITLKELALRVGITEMGLQRIIKTNSTKVETLEKIAKALDVPITDLFKSTDIYENTVYEFNSSSISEMLLNRCDSISDQLVLLKDLYVWEAFFKLAHDKILLYPIIYPGSPEYLLDPNDEIDNKLLFIAKTFIKIRTNPYSKLDESIKDLIKESRYFLDGFYYLIFAGNKLNINSFLHDGLMKDEELIKYWEQYSIITKKNKIKIRLIKEFR